MDVWIGQDGERLGPYAEADVREGIRDGRFNRDDLGWYDGLADWQPLAVLFPEEHPTPRSPSSVPPIPPAVASDGPAAAATGPDNYASFGQRVGAWVVDYLILLVPSSFIAISMGAREAFTQLMAQLHSGVDMSTALMHYGDAVRTASVVTIILGFAYYVLFEASAWQATPGKRLLRLRVCDMQGGRLSLARSAARNAVRLSNLIIVLIPFVCYMAVGFTQRRQGLHDLVAGALVVNGRPAGDTAPSRPATGAPRADGNGSFDA